MTVRLDVILLCFGILFINWICSAEEDLKYKFVKEASDHPIHTSHYDYIIVGGGTAGCPLAATLSENFKVLLLERGGSPYGNHNITRVENFYKSISDDSPSSPSQIFMSEDGVLNTRARVLGGGSCLNAGFYTRASPEYVEKVRWDGKLVNESYPWVERIVAHRPPMKQWQSAVRDALLEVGILPNNGFTYDHIPGTKVGGTIFDADGNRHTAADLLLYANPHNLTVLLHAVVHRVLFSTRGGTRPKAYGVVYRDAKGSKHYASLKKNVGSEIIISAGALGSPQLLMLSGVGPAEHLRSHGIHVLVDQPAVGKGMADNPMNAIFVPSPRPVETSLIQVVGITKFGSYIEAASGSSLAGFTDAFNFGIILSSQVFQCLFAFGSLNCENNHSLSVFSSVDTRQQRTPKSTAQAAENPKSVADRVTRGGFLLEKVIGPLSSGQLLLRNTNVDENPSVSFNYFQEADDLKRCVEGIRTIERVIRSERFAKFTYPRVSVVALEKAILQSPSTRKLKHPSNSTFLERFCQDTVSTIWHYHGGCHVDRVVDRNYRVLGVDALRVIDGSTFTSSPGTNPQATVMMLGRYMGIRITNERSGIRSTPGE